MALRWPDKFPGETILNGVDWTKVLGAATIASCAATVEDGDATVDDPVGPSFTGAVQKIWVAGGAVGSQRVRAEVTLSDGRVLQEDCIFAVLP